MVDGSQEGELGSIAHAQEVIGVNGPGHHASQTLVKCELRFEGDRPLVVVTEPAVTPKNILCE